MVFGFWSLVFDNFVDILIGFNFGKFFQKPKTEAQRPKHLC
jgi:hypothetical protein